METSTDIMTTTDTMSDQMSEKKGDDNVLIKEEMTCSADNGDSCPVAPTESSTGEVNEKVKEEGDDSGLYSYIGLDYTTEVFKIEIRNLPRRVDHKVVHSIIHFIS